MVRRSFLNHCHRGPFLLWLFGAVLAALMHGLPPAFAQDDNFLAPQSTQALGEKKVLMIAVRFPDAPPSSSLEDIHKRVVLGLDRYVREQSYGRASVAADFRGWITLPDSLSLYNVSPFNYRVDRNRIRKLVQDTMTALEATVDFSAYDHLLIIPGVRTMPGQGYGMICYAANPGMLSGVSKGYTPSYETLRSKGGQSFSGGIFVGTENANLGMFAHDYFHALGGVQDGRRLAQCLYDFDRQSDTSAGMPSFDHHAVYMGPWDIMSQHFVRRGEPPPGLSSFTRIRLGWITTDQARQVRAGENALVTLAPLTQGSGTLAIKIPIAEGQHYLIENRQATGFDRVLPDTGLLVLRVNPRADEGHGTVQVMNAAPATPRFARATFKLDDDARNRFVDARNRVAVIPLWKEGDALAVLVTSPEASDAALLAAQAIAAVLPRAGSLPPDAEKALAEALAALRRFDFARSHELIQAAGVKPE